MCPANKIFWAMFQFSLRVCFLFSIEQNDSCCRPPTYLFLFGIRPWNHAGSIRFVALSCKVVQDVELRLSSVGFFDVSGSFLFVFFFDYFHFVWLNVWFLQFVLKSLAYTWGFLSVNILGCPRILGRDVQVQDPPKFQPLELRMRTGRFSTSPRRFWL